MDYQIIQINENSWRIEDHGVRFFLLTGTERALLVDSGMQVHNAREIAESLTGSAAFASEYACRYGSHLQQRTI